MPRSLFALVFAFAAVLGAQESLPGKYASFGRVIVAKLDTAPFPHSSRAGGHTYKGKVYGAAEHYSDNSVAIFIPKGFKETDSIDLVVHFHGWRNSVAGALADFQLIEQFAASGRNAVLVVPEGPRNAPDSSGGKLEDEGGFRRFMDEVAATLRRERAVTKADFAIGRVILSGHSGGYRVMAEILHHGGAGRNIAEVWLFDGLYGRAEKFLAWADRTKGRLINIYTDDGGTKEESEKLLALLRTRGTPPVAAEETELTDAQLRTGGLIFIHTDLGHNDVLAKRGQFRRYLETSGLESLGN
jgi:hypothetical protein